MIGKMAKSHNIRTKREIFFGPIGHTPIDVEPLGYKWVIKIKRMRLYKARLVAQSFSQIPGKEETYSSAIDATTNRFNRSYNL